VYAVPPTVYVDPAYQEMQVGQKLGVNVSLDYAERLYGFEVWLSFDNAILNADSIEYLNYLNTPTMEWHKEVNNIGGYVSYAIASQSPATGKTGGSPPPLVRINFTSLAVGNSQLHFTKTILSDDQARPITHVSADGSVKVVGVGGHDIAVSGISLAKNVICTGYCGNITVAVQNYGSYNELFNLTVFANSTTVQKVPLSLAAGSNLTSLIMWNTTSFTKGDYVIRANASQVLGELNIANNEYIDGTIKVTMRGDVNAPFGVVNILDIVIVAIAFGAKVGDPNWNPNADIGNDGRVNILDVVVIALHFGDRSAL
jgi:hypothetical protein